MTPTYDGNGNLTFDGTFTYGYDAENRLISASGAGNTAAYAYDAQGRRKSKTVNGTTTIFVQDPQGRALLDYDGASGTIQNWYAFGSGPNDVLNQINVTGSTRATTIPDIQGSIVASLDASSGTLTKAGYQTYGESSVTSGTFRYTGARIDAETNGLYDFRARVYSPTLGRFIQADPNGSSGGINLYAYVNNDPLNLVDPFGLCSTCQTSGSRLLSYLAPLPAIAADAASAIAGSTLAAVGAVAAVALVATTTQTAGPEQDQLQLQYVVRGGLNTANNFINGSGVTIDAQGHLQGVSVQTFPNTSSQELSQRQYLPYNQIGVNTLDVVNLAGATVIASPTPNNPYHATLGGISPQTAESLFTPTIPNPNPRLPR